MAVMDKPRSIGKHVYGRDCFFFKDFRNGRTMIVYPWDKTVMDEKCNTLIFAEEDGDPVPAGDDKNPYPAGFDKDPYPAGIDRNPCAYFTYFDPETKDRYVMERNPKGKNERMKLDIQLNDDYDRAEIMMGKENDLDKESEVMSAEEYNQYLKGKQK